MTAVSVKWARLSGAVIADFIFRKTRFSWHYFHKTHEFVDANGVALEPAYVSQFGFQCWLQYKTGRRNHSFFSGLFSAKTLYTAAGFFSSPLAETFFVRRLSHRGDRRRFLFWFDARWTLSIRHHGLFCIASRRPSAYHDAPLCLAGQNEGCCLTIVYLK